AETEERQRTGLDAAAREIDRDRRQALRPFDVGQLRESHRTLATRLLPTTKTAAAAARIADPVSDCARYTTKVLTTIPVATVTNRPVVNGWPGTLAISCWSPTSRRRTMKSAAAVNPKKSQSAKTT